jgi:hypothetical protein
MPSLQKGHLEQALDRVQSMIYRQGECSYIRTEYTEEEAVVDSTSVQLLFSVSQSPSCLVDDPDLNAVAREDVALARRGEAVLHQVHRLRLRQRRRARRRRQPGYILHCV